MATATKPAMVRRASAPVAPPPTLPGNTDIEEMRAHLSSPASNAPSIQTPSTPLTGFDAARAVLDASNYAFGQTYMVPLSKCTRSTMNARVFYLPHEIDEMAESLQKDGQDIPAVGYPKDGKVVIIDGWKRFQAATSVGIAEIKVQIVEAPQSQLDEYLLSERINEKRTSGGTFDEAVKWNEMLKLGIFESQAHIGRVKDLKPEAVNKVIGLNRIPERMMRSMVEHPCTNNKSVAYLVSTIFDKNRIEQMGQEEVEKVAQEIIDEIVRKELTKAQVEALLKKHFEAKKTRAVPETTPVKLAYAKGEFKLFPARGQFQLQLTGVPAAKMESLQQAIQKVLANHE